MGDDIGDDVGEIRFIGGDVATSQNCFISLILNSIFSSMLSVDLTISDDEDINYKNDDDNSKQQNEEIQKSSDSASEDEEIHSKLKF